MINYITIGGVTLDDTVVHHGPTVFECPGGNSVYSALGARLWAEGVGIVSCVGPNYPQEYLSTLENGGLDIRGISRVEVPSQHLWLLYEEDGSRQFVFHKDSGTMDSAIDPTPDQIPVDYLNAKCAHLSAMGFHAQHSLAKFLVQKQIDYSYDIGQAGLEMEWEEYNENFATNHSKMLLPSIEEVEAIYGQQPLLPLLKKISQSGPEIIAIKAGSQGSIVFDAVKNQACQIPIYPTEVIDPTGAGDAYCGGFMAGYYETGSVVEAGLRGTVSASFAIEDFGSFHLLRVDQNEVTKRLNILRKNVETIRTE